MIEPFVIHEIEISSGGRLGICRLPGRSGDLKGDIRTIALWPATILLSMTERNESNAKGAAGLEVALAEVGIQHLQFPIRDFDAPDPASLAWEALAPQLHAALDGGARILLHCMGGKGRSGMVAVRLMIERGMAGKDAVALVRRVRPGAVETEAQLAWAIEHTHRPVISNAHD